MSFYSVKNFRKKNVESGLELLTLYQNGHSAEVSWLDGMQSRVSSQPPVSNSFQDAQQLVDETMVTILIYLDPSKLFN